MSEASTRDRVRARSTRVFVHTRNTRFLKLTDRTLTSGSVHVCDQVLKINRQNFDFWQRSYV